MYCKITGVAVYTVYADEAWTQENEVLRFHRFYGGAMVRADKRQGIVADLAALRSELGLVGELKWRRVSPTNWERVAFMLDAFLEFVDARDITLRYMWLDRLFYNAGALTEYHAEYGYYILYYFFLIYGFGLPYHDLDEVRVEFFPDQLPKDEQKRAEFMTFLRHCHTANVFKGRSPFRIIDVGDVDSRKHVLLQCVDVIIGAVGFRLNRFHERLQANRRRAPGTRAKLALYERIRDHLGAIDMAERGGLAFSVGVSTGTGLDYDARWRNKFRQWNFRQRGAFDPNWNAPTTP